MRPLRFAVTLIMALCCMAALAQTAPFAPDAHTRLLYHCDEGTGGVLHDASGHGQDGKLQGAEWDKGKFGGGLRFNGTDASVFVAKPDALNGLKQITVECWFKPEQMSGRRFLIGHDVGFHYEVDDAVATSISLYNQGGGVPNAEGKPHQQVSSGGANVRSGRWHHLAISYDGQQVSYFLDGVLRDRRTGPKDFSLGVPSRGLWLGCYVGTDYWYSGLLDEVRVSDVARYDPDNKLKVGDRIFDMPQTGRRLSAGPAVRTPVKTGAANLKLTLRKLYGGDATGWVYLKSPGKPAVIVGEYATKGEDGQTTAVSVDVSDEYTGDGAYVIGLVPTNGAYYALIGAELTAAGRQLAAWSGEQRSRWTFRPPVLVALRVGQQAAPPDTLLLPPAQADRASGTLELDNSEAGQPPLLTGDGEAEWWLDCPQTKTYRVSMRYAASAPRPCDIVVDGEDLNDYDMCAVNTTGVSTARDAFWEYQGTVKLGPGLHWLRVQDVLPDIVALRLEPVAVPHPQPLSHAAADSGGARGEGVPWERYQVPAPEALAALTGWNAEAVFGQGAGTAQVLKNAAGLQIEAAFANTDPTVLFAGDCQRFRAPVKWDLEPYGRLSFSLQGTGSQHVVSLWLVDAKGDGKLIWRQRDVTDKQQAVQAPLDFEGNDVFDPGHVVAVCVDLDEGNADPTVAGQMKVTLTGLALQRRDALALPEGYAARVQAALTAVGQQLQKLGAKAVALRSPGFRPWTKPVVPEQHPLYASTEPKPVTRQTMGETLHFTGARGISAGILREFHEDYDFGDICWPHIGILPQRKDYPTDEAYKQALADMEAQLRGVKAHGLYLFDIWGYVPNGEAGPTPQVAPEHHEALLRIFGDRFLGYDNGEQDGRYIGGYSDRGTAKTRREGWDDFVKWDQSICADNLNYMDATGSLNFSHYYGERGDRMLGLETAQGLPSDTLMFGFLRGAGKQYGRLTTQATSIWNRYGYNMYQDRKTDGPNGYGLGPHKGCSLSLHERLFFQSYTGGDSIVGTETAQFTADTLPDGKRELSPLGRQHLQVKQWVGKHPERGMLYTPVAFMLDFHNGWNPPRHLYRSDKYKIWGKFPYEKQDYLIDNMFRMVWPGYEDASYLRNERGFVTPTPYGDIFDVVTNRCRPEILKQYTALMLMGDVELTPEVVANLEQFVAAGGDLLVDAAQAAQLPATLTGLQLAAQASACTTARTGAKQGWAEQPYTYTAAKLATARAALVNEAGDAVLAINKSGKGRVIVCLADRWMTDQLTYADPKLVNMESPFALLRGVHEVLGEYFGSFSPVSVEPAGLNVRVNCYDNDPKRLLVTLTNNDLFADWQGKVQLRAGEVKSLRELRSDKTLAAGAVSVPAGGVAVLDVRLK